ncbi:MAG TPA: 6-phosphogluconolactonase [Novosphingobium sp.]
MSPEIIEGASDADIARWLEARLRTALTETSGEVVVTVPGGSTPFPILSELAKASLDWSRLAVWPGDDRIVPEDHPASNLGRIRALLAPAGARVVPLVEGAEPPRFALAWLGMGNDGHVASLFPNTDPRVDAPGTVLRLTPDPLPPEAPFDRLSLTIPALARSDALLFVVRGAEKAALFRAAAAGDNDLPVARLLKAARCPVTCFV